MSDLTDRRRIHQRHQIEVPTGNGLRYGVPPHILDGYTVAEFVRTARAGWPKVPVPADPLKAAQKVAQQHNSGGLAEWSA